MRFRSGFCWFVAAVLALASLLQGAWAAAATRSGKVKFSGDVNIVSNIPPSATITGTVQVGAVGRFVHQTATLTRNGNTATMDVTLPYSWEFDAVPPTLVVTFSVVISNGPSTFNSVILDMPASGATTSVKIPTSL